MAGSTIGTDATDDDSVRSATDWISHPIAGAAFWCAVVLPFVQLSLLVGGLDTQWTMTAFVLLFVANLLALVLGHQYQQE